MDVVLNVSITQSLDHSMIQCLNKLNGRPDSFESRTPGQPSPRTAQCECKARRRICKWHAGAKVVPPKCHGEVVVQSDFEGFCGIAEATS
jgi:hypothetical protein